MSSTIIEQDLSQEELLWEITEFTKNRDTGFLATDGPAGLRVSPVKYFVDDDLNIYIHSKGGSKFTNLAASDRVCLLVATDFVGDYHSIKGVQFFGNAQVLEAPGEHYAEAVRICPWPSDGDGKFIHIASDHAVYVDRIEHSDLKQEWSRTN